MPANMMYYFLILYGAGLLMLGGFILFKINEPNKPPTEKECPACKVYQDYVKNLQWELQFMRDIVGRTPEAAKQAKEYKPVSMRGNTWNTLRNQLEDKHKKPEDKVQDYWVNKNRDTEAKLAEMDAALQQDVSELEK